MITFITQEIRLKANRYLPAYVTESGIKAAQSFITAHPLSTPLPYVLPGEYGSVVSLAWYGSDPFRYCYLITFLGNGSARMLVNCDWETPFFSREVLIEKIMEKIQVSVEIIARVRAA